MWNRSTSNRWIKLIPTWQRKRRLIIENVLTITTEINLPHFMCQIYVCHMQKTMKGVDFPAEWPVEKHE